MHLKQSSIRPHTKESQAFRVVLHRGLRYDWVTHLENLEDDGKGGYRSKIKPDYYWGHYFDDVREALRDYDKRCRVCNLLP